MPCFCSVTTYICGGINILTSSTYWELLIKILLNAAKNIAKHFLVFHSENLEQRITSVQNIHIKVCYLRRTIFKHDLKFEFLVIRVKNELRWHKILKWRWRKLMVGANAILFCLQTQLWSEKSYPTKTAIEDWSHSTLAESPTKDKKVRKKKIWAKLVYFNETAEQCHHSTTVHVKEAT
jgi:hypothetical protein